MGKVIRERPHASRATEDGGDSSGEGNGFWSSIAFGGEILSFLALGTATLIAAVFVDYERLLEGLRHHQPEQVGPLALVGLSSAMATLAWRHRASSKLQITLTKKVQERQMDMQNDVQSTREEMERDFTDLKRQLKDVQAELTKARTAADRAAKQHAEERAEAAKQHADERAEMAKERAEERAELLAMIERQHTAIYEQGPRTGSGMVISEDHISSTPRRRR